MPICGPCQIICRYLPAPTLSQVDTGGFINLTSLGIVYFMRFTQRLLFPRFSGPLDASGRESLFGARSIARRIPFRKSPGCIQPLGLKLYVVSYGRLTAIFQRLNLSKHLDAVGPFLQGVR